MKAPVIKTTSRVRSPNYPYYSLKECISLLEKLYEKYNIKEIHYGDAIIQMGHSITSSTAGRVLASMLTYGLLESRGSKDSKFVRISHLAQEILLEKEDSPHRSVLLRQSALKDNSIQAIWEKWAENIPPEETIIKSLQLEMNYSPEGAKRFASVIIETYDFAGLTKPPDQHKEEESGEEENEGDLHKKPPHDIPPSLRKANLLLQGENREIIIYAPADLTDEEFDRVLRWLELQKIGLVNDVKKEINDNKQSV